MKISTNLSAKMVQKNLTKSTDARNTAIEQLKTGCRINHASDNAANYSIANDYSSKLSSYSMAETNVASGLALLSTAQDTISLMQSHGQRIQSLMNQARNGSIGNESLDSLNKETESLLSEINLLYKNTEYNGISLFNWHIPEWADEIEENAGVTSEVENKKTIAEMTAAHNGFLAEIETVTPDVIVENAEDLADAIANNSIIGIANGAVLKKLSDLGSAGNICAGKTIVLTDDIDLSAYQAGTGWTSISNFKGVFDGQGHKITGLKINNGSSRGLFSGLDGSSVVVKNLGIEGAYVNVGSNGGILTGTAWKNCTIKNCYTTGTFNETYTSGGSLVGRGTCKIEDCYSTAKVSGDHCIGGLIGNSWGSTFTNCHYEGNVTGSSWGIGGLIGQTNPDYSLPDPSTMIKNCTVSGKISGTEWIGGAVGVCSTQTNIQDCIVEADIKGTQNIGGMIGCGQGAIIVKNCRYTGTVKGTSNIVGGFVGKIQYPSEIQNCSAEADVSGTYNVGGFIGQNTNSITIKNCQVKGSVTGTEYRIGGFIGNASAQINIQNCFAETDVTGAGMRVGGFIGSVGGEGNKVIKNCYSKGTVNNTSKFTGGFIGSVEHANDSQTTKIDNCLSYSAINAEDCVGSFIGAFINPEDTAEARFNNITITNCLTDFYKEGVSQIGGWYATKDDTEAQEFDSSKWASNIQVIKPNTVTLHTGISSEESNSITFDMTFKLNLSNISNNITNETASSTLNEFMNILDRKATEIGTASSRLESSLDSIYSGINNLASALSVVKDADIAKASSQYLRQQILQQASATLFSTTNQTPAMALKLIGLE